MRPSGCRSGTWVSKADLEDIFQNPRVHTDAGYHRLGDGTKVEADRVAALSTYGSYFDDEETNDQFVSNSSFPIDEAFESISIGFDCFLIPENDGTVMYSSGLPKYLHNKLNGKPLVCYRRSSGGSRS